MGGNRLPSAGHGRRVVIRATSLVCRLSLAVVVAGCAAHSPGTSPTPTPEELMLEFSALNLSPGELRAYRDIDERVFSSGGSTWAVMPRSVAVLQNGFVEFTFDEDDGLLGSVLSVDYDSRNLWLGTSGGVNHIDTVTRTLYGYVPPGDTTDTYIRYLSADERGNVWVITREAVAWVNTAARTWKKYPFNRFSYHDLREVVFDGNRIWMATSNGLRRFSRDWKAWDAVPGSRELAKVPILGIERDAEGVLWTLTTRGIYYYRPGFDSWRLAGK